MPALPPDRPGCRKGPGGRRPLPDPAAIRLYLVPDPAPPYDEEIAADGATTWEGSAGEPGGGRLPGGPPRAGEPGAGAPGGGQAPDGIRGVPRPAAGAPRTPPGWADRFAQALAEALAGSRPPRQLVPWTTQEAMDRIQRLGPRLASAQRPLVRRVVTSWPAPDVLEMTVVVGFGPRVRAVAVRLERAGACPPGRPGDRAADGWVCTAVEAA
jgi:uncharacterized protein DUF6459